MFDGDDRLPVRVVEAGLRPTGQLDACVVRLTLVQAGPANRSRRRAPRLVGHDDARRSVGVLELQLAEERRPRAVAVPAEVLDQRAPVPPVADDPAEHVHAVAQERSHVERVVAEVMVIARPTGSERVVADALTVQLELVQTERARVQARPGHRRRDPEFAPKVRTRLRRLGVLVPRGADERRSPVVCSQQARFDSDGFAPLRHRSVDAIDAHLHCTTLPRHQCRRGPGDEHRLAGLDDLRCRGLAVGGGDANLVLRLEPPGRVRERLPRDARGGGADDERLGLVFDGELRHPRSSHPQESRISQLRTPASRRTRRGLAVTDRAQGACARPSDWCYRQNGTFPHTMSR